MALCQRPWADPTARVSLRPLALTGGAGQRPRVGPSAIGLMQALNSTELGFELGSHRSSVVIPPGESIAPPIVHFAQPLA